MQFTANNDPSTAELAEMLNLPPNGMCVSTDTLRREIIAGRLQGYRDHRGHYRVKREEFERLMREKREAQERQDHARLMAEMKPIVQGASEQATPSVSQIRDVRWVDSNEGR
jgi:excisionase family DNA binding protein